MFVPPTVRFLACSVVTPSVEVAEVKNFCSDDCALTASCTVSDCKMNKTATRAKSRTCSLTENVDVGEALLAVAVVADAVVSVPAVAVAVVVVAVGVDEALPVRVVAKMVENEPPDVVRGSVRVLTKTDTSVAAESNVRVTSTPDMMVTVMETAASACTTLESTSTSRTAALVVVRDDEPSNVTSAFSATQERFAELNLDRIVVADSGREKFVWPSWMRRGIDCPSVTLLKVPSEEARSVVVQPWELDVVQSFPVNPLVQIHEHTPSVTTFVPPFEQVNWVWQSESSG